MSICTLFYFILSILDDINRPNQLSVSVLLYFSSFIVSFLGHIDEPNQLYVSILFYFNFKFIFSFFFPFLKERVIHRLIRWLKNA